ncbi:hypothetical protein IFM61392_00839 [Aspergillus lentulus]|uniref:Uncharacterized protein n=1 Tax=Aspergillus lentulus TaxID=293939 RepID=A0AAN5YJ48_ASPLE|nr:hypothetical protein CNMCM7927_007428 [Aspergillus lentulus]KAF4201665.1 hypothetical protein CNMCM8927_001266 [Aspergillus lentulus]GFF99456.1 hypothetical protein IFM61392_00839 [Aspergillus lentulus]
MVSLGAILASNRRLESALPAGLVAVFGGATSGIDETATKQFAKHANAPRIYFVGRTDSWAERIKTELKTINPKGSYFSLQCDASLLKSVDEVCQEIKAKETVIGLLFLSIGSLITGTSTVENLHYFAALTYYSRIRFAMNLLPLIRTTPALRRVVTVFKLSATAGRGHFASMLTLSFEVLAQKAPEVSFIHDYPGFVKTDLARGTNGVGMAIVKGLFKVIGPFLYNPLRGAFQITYPKKGDLVNVYDGLVTTWSYHSSDSILLPLTIYFVAVSHDDESATYIRDDINIALGKWTISTIFPVAEAYYLRFIYANNFWETGNFRITASEQSTNASDTSSSASPNVYSTSCPSSTTLWTTESTATVASSLTIGTNQALGSGGAATVAQNNYVC